MGMQMGMQMEQTAAALRIIFHVNLGSIYVYVLGWGR